MADDVLAPFRRAGALPTALAPKRTATGYRAFSATSAAAKPLRLELRPKDGLAVARLYSSLTEIAYDRGDYTGILLIFAGQAGETPRPGAAPRIAASLTNTARQGLPPP